MNVAGFNSKRLTGAALLASAAILGPISCPAEAAVVDSGSASPITSYLSYRDYGGGDVIFKISSTVPGCEDGFWFSKSDPTFEQNFSILMTAYFSGRAVRVYGDNVQRWSGSTGAYCRLQAIGFW